MNKSIGVKGMYVDEKEFEELQKQIGSQANTNSSLSVESIKYIAGFDVLCVGRQVFCAAVVLDAVTMKVVERKHAVGKTPMPYIPGLQAFREGPALVQLYYDIEHEPDVVLVSGHGIAHPYRCGIATYVGVELQKPTIGIAKSLFGGNIVNETAVINGEVCGRILKTKEHANPVVVSPGHLVTADDALLIVQKYIIPPHKLPEPLALAHKYVKHILRNGPSQEVKEACEDEIPEEYRVNAGMIV